MSKARHPLFTARFPRRHAEGIFEHFGKIGGTVEAHRIANLRYGACAGLQHFFGAVQAKMSNELYWRLIEECR